MTTLDMNVIWTEKTKALLRNVIAPISPSRRRWQRFLRSFSLDPDQLQVPLDEPGKQDFIICGFPRSGTTLLSAMLFQPPHVVTVMEPWDGMRMPPSQLFCYLRKEIAETGKLTKGKLDIERLLQWGQVKWCAEGESSFPIAPTQKYWLGVKWPAFWRYLGLLSRTKFLVCVRHPFETIASFKQKGGRLAQGLDYDLAFNRTVNEWLIRNATDDALRRVLFYEYIGSHIARHSDRHNVLIIHYERWFQEPERLMSEIRQFLGAPLTMGPALIQKPSRTSTLSPDEIELIRRHCKSARLLGYSL